MVENTKSSAFIYRFNEEQKEPLFLLLKRKEELGGYWQPVTGTVEKGETLLHALHREVKEETGLVDIKATSQPVFRFSFHKGGASFLEYVYGVQTNQTEIVLSSEHSEYKWILYGQAINTLFWGSNKKGLQRVYMMLESDSFSGEKTS